jgi:hypothetical protein
VQALLDAQRLDGSADDGAFSAGDRTWQDGRQVAYFFNFLASVRCCPEPFGVEVDRLDRALRAAMAFCLRRQAPDGRLDLGGSYSPNEAGFPLPAMASAYRHLARCAPELFADLGPSMLTFMQRAAESVLAGHAHTANHRWAAAAGPLAAVHVVAPDPRYLAKIDAYLADGIDCDPDGFWFEERSPNYNMVANHGMLVLADALSRRDLADHAVRSCLHVLSFIQPNGEADSSFSHRQDRGQADRVPAWYGIARRAAILSGDGRLSSLARSVRSPRDNDLRPMIFEWLDHPGPMPPAEPIATRYRRRFDRAGILRHRQDDTALTLAVDRGGHFYDRVRDQFGGPRRSEDWFHLHHGPIVLQSIRLQLAAPGAIQPALMQAIDDEHVRLSHDEPGWTHHVHFRPGTPTILMPHRSSHVIDVRIAADEIALDLDCRSPDVLCASLNLFIRPGASIDGLGVAQPGDRHLWVEGQPLVLRQGEHRITIVGLPPADLHQAFLRPAKIPGQTEEACACVSVGLRLPIRLSLRCLLERADPGEPSPSP